MSRQPQRGRTPLPRAGSAWLLAALLLLAQGLGLVHGISHGIAPGKMAHRPACGLPASPAPAGPAAAAACEDKPAAHAHGGAHEAGDAQCRLVDQLAHADGLPTAAMPPGALRTGCPVPATALRLALAEGGLAAYLARAPPRG